jgi:DNA-binding Lrp family transcriptional regulator
VWDEIAAMLESEQEKKGDPVGWTAVELAEAKGISPEKARKLIRSGLDAGTIERTEILIGSISGYTRRSVGFRVKQ